MAAPRPPSSALVSAAAPVSNGFPAMAYATAGGLPSPADHAPRNTGPNYNQLSVNSSSGPKTIVIKIGSASLSSADGRYLHQSRICSLVEEICRLRKAGHRVILVTSGAVSVGCLAVRMDKRPESRVLKRAIAAVGQSRLMRAYDDFFDHLEQPIAQVLLSRENFGDRRSYNNICNTFLQLLQMGVVPVVNENDTVSLRTGDNDTLSALVATLVDANWLFLLTDVDGLFTANPRKDPKATRIPVVPDLDQLRADVGGAGQWGTGGMLTKLGAARIATSAGITTVICNSEDPRMISKILGGVSIGTLFLPSQSPIKGKKKWIAHGTVPSGAVILDEGAVRAVHAKKSLFATGIIAVEGHFSDSDTICLLNSDRTEIARGLTNFSSAEILLIRGQPSEMYADRLGYSCASEVIHRDNLVLLSDGRHIREDMYQMNRPRTPREQPFDQQQQQQALQANGKLISTPAPSFGGSPLQSAVVGGVAVPVIDIKSQPPEGVSASAMAFVEGEFVIGVPPALPRAISSESSGSDSSHQF